MQGIPYKAIAILGMNYDKLPRKHTALSFDLMSADKQIGDPDGKEQDKYTFLLALLSAQENLYLSYIGRSAKDNSKRPPSLLIEQLIDYVGVKQAEPSPDNKIWVQHPLHSFSSKYNNKKYPRLISFDVAEKSEKKASSQTELNAADYEFDFSSIRLDRLIAFFKDPFKVYFNKKLGYYFNEEENSLPEMEILKVDDNLAKHTIKAFLMENPSDEEKIEFILKSKHGGLLPLAELAYEELAMFENEIDEIRARYISLQDNAAKDNYYGIILISGKELNGNYSLFNDKQITYCTSKWDSTPKYLIDIWIRHLFIRAIGLNVNSWIVLKENKINKANPDVRFSASCITQEEALKQIDKLVKLYIKGHNEVVPFDLSLFFDTKYKADYCQQAIDLEITTEQVLSEDPLKVADALQVNFIEETCSK